MVEESVRIRVLFVIATLDRAGAEKQMVLLCTRLDRGRFDPMVVCLTRGGPLEKELRLRGIPYVILGKKHKIDLLVLMRLMRLIRRFRPHVVHMWLFTANTYGRLAALLAPTKVGCVIASERCVDVWKGPIHRLIDRSLARRTALVVANARAVADFCVSEGIPESKICVIPNGFDFESFRPLSRSSARETLSIPESAKAVAFVGRLEKQKGVSVLLEAARYLNELPDFLLLIIGEGPEEQSLKEQAEDARLLKESVRFVGSLEDAASILPAFDVVVLPSLWEGLPNVLIEAMASGVPVVATHVGGVSELVEDGRTGFLVRPGESRPLAEKIRYLLEHPFDARGMGEVAQNASRQKFNLERTVHSYEEAYLEALGFQSSECPSKLGVPRGLRPRGGVRSAE